LYYNTIVVVVNAPVARLTPGHKFQADFLFSQTLISVVSCAASVAALVILVVIFVGSPIATKPPASTTTTTRPPPATPVTPVTPVTPACERHVSNVFISCSREIRATPSLFRETVERNGSFQDTTVTGNWVAG
jgi:hypothetical protein